MKKERTIKRWKQLVWAKLSKVVRLRAKNHCMRCGKFKETKRLQAHHLVPKSHGNYAMFCEDNIVALCHYCHLRWWHGSSTWDEQRDLVEKWITLTKYQDIKFESNKTHKYSASDYEKMLADYTEKVKKLEEDLCDSI